MRRLGQRLRRGEKAKQRLIFREGTDGRGQRGKAQKTEKKFKKGVALLRFFEENVEDVCKGDEAADCSLAGEGTAADHVRQSDDGSRSVMQGNSQASRT